MIPTIPGYHGDDPTDARLAVFPMTPVWALMVFPRHHCVTLTLNPEPSVVRRLDRDAVLSRNADSALTAHCTAPAHPHRSQVSRVLRLLFTATGRGLARSPAAALGCPP